MTTRSHAAAPARRGDAGPATRTAAGIGLMVLAILLFTVMDTLGKDLTGRYPVPQVVWARYFFQLALMMLLIPRVGFMDHYDGLRQELLVDVGVGPADRVRAGCSPCGTRPCSCQSP